MKPDINHIRYKLNKWCPHLAATVCAIMYLRSDACIGDWFAMELGLTPTTDWSTAVSIIRSLLCDMPDKWRESFTAQFEWQVFEAKLPCSEVGTPVPAAMELSEH